MDANTARKLLETERDELTRIAVVERDAIARAADDLYDELGTADRHQADAASVTFDRECDATIVRLVEERSAEVAHALRKLDAGTYGTCESCGKPIPDARLRARPDARFCEHDERTWELSRIAFDDPGPIARTDDAREPGWAELALLPDDDDLEEHIPMAPEQAALHEEEDAHRLTAIEIEEMEARITEDLARAETEDV